MIATVSFRAVHNVLFTNCPPRQRMGARRIDRSGQSGPHVRAPPLPRSTREDWSIRGDANVELHFVGPEWPGHGHAALAAVGSGHRPRSSWPSGGRPGFVRRLPRGPGRTGSKPGGRQLGGAGRTPVRIGAVRGSPLRPRTPSPYFDEVAQSFSSIVTLSMTTRSSGVPERLPTFVDLVDDVQAGHYFAEQRVQGGQATPSGPLITKNWLPLVSGPALAIASEPTLYLPGPAVRPGIGSRGRRTRSGGVAALEHEARDDAMEHDAVVVVVPRQEDEAVDRPGRRKGVERDHHGPVRCDHGGHVPLVRIDVHRPALRRTSAAAGSSRRHSGGVGLAMIRMVPYDSLMVTVRCVASLSVGFPKRIPAGRSCRPRSGRSSPVRRANSVLGRPSPWVPETMKNWLPPVFAVPELAMTSEPRGYCCAGFDALGGVRPGSCPRALTGVGLRRVSRLQHETGDDPEEARRS